MASTADRHTPDMHGKASEIEDPTLLFARIGYRIFLSYRANGDRAEFYAGYNNAELKQLKKLLG